jgi:Ser-tRNA(Ala) deacylase AlaX
MSLYQPYHTDAYLKEVVATAVGVEGDRVALDRTVFYARGGQPADRGRARVRSASGSGWR